MVGADHSAIASVAEFGYGVDFGGNPTRQKIVILTGEPMPFIGSQRRILRRNLKCGYWQSLCRLQTDPFAARRHHVDNTLRCGAPSAARVIAQLWLDVLFSSGV